VPGPARSSEDATPARPGAALPAGRSAATTNVYGEADIPATPGPRPQPDRHERHGERAQRQGGLQPFHLGSAINMTQAERNEIQKRQLATDTYFEMRATNKAARAAEAAPRPTMEQLTASPSKAPPKPLAPGEWDPTTGKLIWPSAYNCPVLRRSAARWTPCFVKFASTARWRMRSKRSPPSHQRHVRRAEAQIGQIRRRIICCAGITSTTCFTPSPGPTAMTRLASAQQMTEPGHRPKVGRGRPENGQETLTVTGHSPGQDQ